MATLKELIEDPTFKMGKTKVTQKGWPKSQFFLPYIVSPEGNVLGEDAMISPDYWKYDHSTNWELYVHPVFRWQWTYQDSNNRWVLYDRMLSEAEAKKELAAISSVYKKVKGTQTEFENG